MKSVKNVAKLIISSTFVLMMISIIGAGCIVSILHGHILYASWIMIGFAFLDSLVRAISK